MTNPQTVTASDVEPGPVSARQAAGSALRTILNGVAPAAPGTDPRVAPVPWAALPEWRQEKWCEHADVVVDAVLGAFRTGSVDPLARELYRQDHAASGQMDDWTMPHWDIGGDQHVNKEPWRARARQVITVLAAAYRTPPTR